MTRDQRIYRFTYWIASIIIAAVLCSGYKKILFPADFAVSVYRFRLLPGPLVNLFAIYVSWLEMVCAVCLLLIPRYRAAALWVVMLLLLFFTAAIGINLWRGSLFGCGCFGRAAAEEPLSWMNVARNAGLLLLGAFALVARRKTADASQETGPAEPDSFNSSG